MSKPATYEPLVIEELKRHPEGITRRELREAVGCSSQQIHKIVEKGKLPEGHRQHLPIAVIGKGDFGSDIVAWMGDGRSTSTFIAPVAGTQVTRQMPKVEGVPAFGQRLRVVALAEDEKGVAVTVETDDGRRLTLHG